jgi:hypothetical protein
MLSARLRTAITAAIVGVLAVLGFTLGSTSATAASIPFNVTQYGPATYYDNEGYGACGTWINAATEMLVAVPASYWTSANPNLDPLCSGVSVQVTYNGKTITVPVKDQCPSCEPNHIDLSQAAFAQFASADSNTTPGVLNVSWKFVSSSGGGTTPPPSGGGTGQITNQSSGKCIGAAGGTLNNGNAVDLYSCVGSSTQQWTVGSDNTIKIAGTNMCLDLTNGNTADGTPVQLWTCYAGSSNQQWTYNSSTHDIVSLKANKCLDLPGGSTADFTKAQIYTCNGTSAQKWNAA